jgi:hypothetical protein
VIQMAQPGAFDQGLAAFLSGAGNQLVQGKNKRDAEALWNRQREAQVEDRTQMMKQQQDFQRETLDANRFDRRFAQADGIYHKLATTLGIEQEKDPKKREAIYLAAENEMKKYYPKDYEFYATEVMKGRKPLSSIDVPPPAPGSTGGPMESLSRLALGQKNSVLPADSLGTAFPRAMGRVSGDLENIKDYGIPGAMMAGSPVGGVQKLMSAGSDVLHGGAEIIGNTMGIGTPKPMRPMAPQQMPNPMMPQTPTPTPMPSSMAPRLMKNPKAKLRKRI